jgi:hypothetical protein
MSRWNVTEELSKAHLTQVFSGGACNVLDAEGNLLRNSERDGINDWLTKKRIIIFDPQIHPDTHGEEYDFAKHSKLEIAAREAATLNLYEISPRTFGGISSLEIAADHFRWQEPMVLYYSDGNKLEDRIPDHTPRGHPLFVPYGIHKNDAASKAHYREMVKNANNMRKYLMHFAREMGALTVSFSGLPGPHDIVITPDRMHAADIFEAVVRASSGQRVFVHFDDDETRRDEKGNPVFGAPQHPREMELHALLDQYVDEGNELRKRIAELVGINVYVRIVYTQRSAILALEELLILKKMLKPDN